MTLYVLVGWTLNMPTGAGEDIAVWDLVITQ